MKHFELDVNKVILSKDKNIYLKSIDNRLNMNCTVSQHIEFIDPHIISADMEANNKMWVRGVSVFIPKKDSPSIFNYLGNEVILVDDFTVRDFICIMKKYDVFKMMFPNFRYVLKEYELIKHNEPHAKQLTVEKIHIHYTKDIPTGVESPIEFAIWGKYVKHGNKYLPITNEYMLVDILDSALSLNCGSFIEGRSVLQMQQPISLCLFIQAMVEYLIYVID